MYEVHLHVKPELQLGDDPGVLAFYEYIALCDAGEYSAELIIPDPYVAKAISAAATEGSKDGPVISQTLVNTSSVQLSHDGKICRIRFSHHHKGDSGKGAALNVGVQGMLFFRKK